MHFRVASPDQERGICTENVLNAAFVSARGEVSPCAYTSLPAAQRVSLAAFQKQEITPRLTFGNVNERSLSTIWGSTGYRAFRHRHDTGNHHSPCLDCPKLLMGWILPTPLSLFPLQAGISWMRSPFRAHFTHKDVMLAKKL